MIDQFKKRKEGMDQYTRNSASDLSTQTTYREARDNQREAQVGFTREQKKQEEEFSWYSLQQGSLEINTS